MKKAIQIFVALLYNVSASAILSEKFVVVFFCQRPSSELSLANILDH
jgi:hypothetical protein